MTNISSIQNSFRKGRVSVIIPTYNYANFLPFTIDSVLRQNYKDTEILVIDDGSTDETAEIISSFKSKINYVFQENAGLSAARNKGIDISTGEYILFLDADDMLGSNLLYSQVKFLKDHPIVSISVCRNKLFKTTGSNGIPKPTGEWALFRRSLSVHLCYLNIAPPHAFLSRREAIIQTGPFDPNLKACEDYEFWLRAATMGFTPTYNPDGIVYYRRHHNSMSANHSRQVYFDSIVHKRLSDLLDRFPGFPENYRLEALLAFCSGGVYTAGKLRTHHPDLVENLMESVQKRIEEARMLASDKPQEWNSLIKLNYMRIVSCLIHPFFHNSKFALNILENLTQILSAMKVPDRKLQLIRNFTLSAATDSNPCIVEKKTLRRLCLRYLKNNLFRLACSCWQNNTVKV